MQSDVIRLEATLDFSADDDLTPEIDFGVPVKLLWVYVPTIDSATVDIQAATDDFDTMDSPAGTPNYVTVATDILGGAGTGDDIALLESTTDIVAFQKFKIATSVGQTADRTFEIMAKMC